MLRDAIAELESTARRLDPGQEQRDDLWGAVGAHVLGNLSSLGEAAAFSTDGVPDAEAFAIAETPTEIADALITIKAVEQTGINQASG